MAKVSYNHLHNNVSVVLSLEEAIALHAITNKTCGNLIYDFYDKLDDCLGMANKALNIIKDDEDARKFGSIIFTEDAASIINKYIEEHFVV